MSIEQTFKTFPAIPTAKFCETYQLGSHIFKLLDDQGFYTADALLYANEFDLMDAGFQVGHIAELKWTLKKILVEMFSTAGTVNTEGKNKPALSGTLITTARFRPRISKSL